MKYIRYILIGIWTIIRKIIGVPVTLIVAPFRGWANNVVFNYALQNKDVYIKRLSERPITLNQISGNWDIGPYHGTDGGYIRYRKISKIEYIIAYWCVFGWMDQDSNYDTFCNTYNQTIIDGERMTWLPQYIIDRLTEDNEVCRNTIYGNTFDLGDKRADYSVFRFWSVLLWSIRNTAYGFKYMQFETDKPRSEWFWLDISKLGGTGFGNRPKDGRLEFGWF